MTFVDTGAWFATMVPTDPRHRQVIGWVKASSGPLVTTEYVIDETLTFLRSRGHAVRAVRFGRQVLDLSAYAVHYQRDELRLAWELFRDQPQRKWSFTDCTSMTVIERLHIKQVLTFDHHFGEFGALTLVP